VAPFNGPVERRAGALISIDREPLGSRMKAYFDPDVSNEEVRLIYGALMMTGNRIVGPQAREKILSEHRFSPGVIVRYPFKVFDVRWSYLENLRPLFSEPSPQLLLQRFDGNAFFVTRDAADKTPEGPPFFYSGLVCDYDAISGHARHFPVRVRNGRRLERRQEASLFDALGDKPEEDESVANLSKAARNYLRSLKIREPDADGKTAALVWLHALAIGYSPAYLTENADGVRRDWPRIPLPAERKALEASAALGEQIAALLNTEADASGVTSGKISPWLKGIGVPSKVGGGELDPNAEYFAVTAGWGHKGKEGVTMPARGKLHQRAYDDGERQALDAEAAARGTSAAEARRLGDVTCDVYLNGTAYWRNVPRGVWEYYIGGYQVIKKWLSYREEGILGRALKPEEVREVTNTVRRIAAIILLQPKLDENYRHVKEATFDWSAL
jgi:hypothetical protein